MTSLLADPVKPIALHRSEARERSGTPLRVLAVVDSTESTGRVTKYLLRLKSWNDAVDVVLLNVQPQPETGRLRGYGSFRRAEVDDRLINDLGRRVVTSAGRYLDAAHIAHRGRIELGDPVATIVRCADEEHCDLIVLAEARPNIVSRWLMRNTGIVLDSVASVVIHCANAPVVIAK